VSVTISDDNQDNFDDVLIAVQDTGTSAPP
jgi:hypothetical protein